jgi:hypothetical protein
MKRSMKASALLFMIMMMTKVVLFRSTNAVEPRDGPLKVTASWRIPLTDRSVKRIVEGAKDLGFNAYAWGASQKEQVFLLHARKNHLKTFRLIEPLQERKGACLQKMESGEESLPGSSEIPSNYQYGGEPVPGNLEVLDRELACPLDPGVIPHAMYEVRKAKQLGYNGVCWDFIGYRNYHTCECVHCQAAFSSYCKAHPDLDEAEAKAMFYEDLLVRLFSELYVEVKQIDRTLLVMCHCHPVYLPDVFYGRRIAVDYCGITVSWFFLPHWTIEKVRKYTIETVQGPYSSEKVIGMPMIGFYCSGEMEAHRRSGGRLLEELGVLREACPRAVMVCELGDILGNQEAREAIKKGLSQLE